MLSRGSIATAYRSVLEEEDVVEPGPLSAQISGVRQRLRDKRRAATQ
jgi:hypothetical protein